MKSFLTIIFTALLALSVAGVAYASGESNCQPVYGGGEVCQKQIKFTINKLVGSPTKGGNFVENLTVNDPRYSAGAEIPFKITITNTGNTEITNLSVVDTFPQYLTFLSGAGVNTKGSSQINFTVEKIAAGQTLEYVITAKAADAGNLPANQAITCVVNKVSATTQDGNTANDNAQVCIEKPIVTPTPVILPKPMVKQIPSTGPETDILLGLVSTGALGYFIRRKLS